MKLDFVKMHGCGNDYIYAVGLDRTLPEDAPALARKLSRRRFSVGSDGLVYVLRGERAPFRMRMWNADGSEAEMCGNAIRCVAKLIADGGHSKEKTIPIETGNGVLSVTVETSRGKVTRARVAMGTPVVSPEETVDVRGERVRGRAVSVGNPHFIVFREPTDDAVLRLGPLLEKHERFPARTNVEFVEKKGEVLETRVWERGSGETLACGTGACAVLAAARTAGLAGDRAVVRLPGGDLECEWPGGAGTIWLTGPCEVAFTGSVEID